jgi:autotransporter-associated beta strand protein
LLAVPQVQAQTNIWTNPITGTDPGLSNPYTTGDVVASNITVSGIGRGGGVTGSAAANRYNATSWDTVAIDLTAYFTFTLTPTSGFEIDFNSFVYTGQASGTGPTSFAFRSSVDGFAANIGTPNASGTTISLSGASYQSITSAIEFRLYGWGASAAGGTRSVDQFNFTGLVNSTGGGPTGYFWAGDGLNLGGSGTWSTGNTNWSATNSPILGIAWDSTKTAIFTNPAGTVTVDTVSANAGIQFATDGYMLSGGTLTLGGASAAANTITTDAGVTATINSALSGSAGMTKVGAGTLVLGGANGYTGGTLISAGALQGDTTSLQGTITNSGSVVFNQSTNGAYGSVLSGAGTLIKIGAATLTLSGANGFTGAMTISNGAVRLANATGAGTVAGGIAVTSGAALELTGGISVGAEALTLNGFGLSSGGALRNISGDNIYGGLLTLGAASRINSDSGTLTLTNTGTITGPTFGLTLGGAGNITINSIIGTTTGTLTKDGAGTAMLTAASTYSGGTLISEGTLQIDSGGAAGSIGGAITNNATLLYNRSGTLTQATVISGTGALNKAGTGTLTLSGANSYAGLTTISNGAIRVSNATALGTADVGTVVASGGALELTGSLTIGAEALSLAGTGISGGGALRNISSDNIYGGAITLAGATEIASDASRLTLTGGITGAGQALTVDGSGDVTISTTGINTGSAGSLAKTGGGGLTLAAGGDYTGATTIGTGGEIVAAHANALGTTAAGTTVSSGGALWLSNNITIGAEALSLAGTGVSSTGALRNISGNNALGGAITLAGATTIQSAPGTSLSLSGGITGTGLALTINDTGNTTISGTGINTSTGGALTKDQSGVLTILASSDYTGGTTLSAGTIRVGNNSALGTGAVTTSGGAILASDSSTARALANNFTINGSTTFGEATTGTGDLALNGALALGGAGRTITVNNGLTTVNGVISGTSGNALTKSGTGTLLLNAANTYSGATTISAGTLALGTAGSIASSTITVNSTLDLTAKTSGYALGSTATLAGTGTVTTASEQTLSVGGGATIRPATASTSGTLNVSGLTFGSTGAYAFSIGNVSGTAGTEWDLLNVTSAFDITATSESKFTINVAGNSGNPTGFSNTGNYSWDILTLGSGSISGFDASKFNLVNNFTGSSGTLSLTSDGSKLTLNYAAGDATIVTWSSALGSAWLTTGNWTGGVVPTSIDVAQFGVNPTPGTTVGINMGGNSGTQSVGAIEVTTGRSLDLTITNSSSTANGILTLSGGKLNSVDNVVLRNNSAQVLTLANGSSRTMGVALGNATDNVVLIDSTGGITISSIISGSDRKLTKAGSGAGILTLSGANTFSGGVDLDAGTLRLSSTAAAGTGTLTQADGTSTLQINVAGTVANNMSLYNVAFLQGANLSGAITLNNTVFDVTNNVTATNSGTLSGNGGVQKIGAGTLALSGANTYSGGTTISNGAVSVSSDGNLGLTPVAPEAGNVTLNGGKLLVTSGFTMGANRGLEVGASGGTVEVAASQNLGYSGIVAGSGALTKAGTGTFTLSGSSTFSGATTVSAGVLNLANASGSALGSTASISVATNATLLISQAGQVNDSASVSLSGGTIRTATGVSEVFGNLSVTGSGLLDFGTTSYANANTISFGTYTPSALLTIDNFNFGSTLIFKSNLTDAILGNSFATFNSGGIANYSWDNDSSTFTITAIPEPSTYLAAAGLLSLMLWPSRRRIIRNAKKILGLTPPMRDRLAARSKA